MLLFCPISRIARPYGSMHGGCRQVDKLYKLQIRAARVIKGLTYETRSKDIFQNLQWSPINIIFKKREDIMTFKALRCMTPKYISDLFLPSFNSNYKLRSNGNKLDLEKPNTNFLKNSYSYRTAASYNKLPKEIIQRCDKISVQTFKKLIDEHYNK